jgi:hypothetical protein
MSRTPPLPSPKFILLAFERLPADEQLRRIETIYDLIQRRLLSGVA